MCFFFFSFYFSSLSSLKRFIFPIHFVVKRFTFLFISLEFLIAWWVILTADYGILLYRWLRWMSQLEKDAWVHNRNGNSKFDNIRFSVKRATKRTFTLTITSLWWFVEWSNKVYGADGMWRIIGIILKQTLVALDWWEFRINTFDCHRNLTRILKNHSFIFGWNKL